MNTPIWSRRHTLAALGSLPAALLVPGLRAWAHLPDGRYVVHGLSAAGSEDSVARILDVSIGQLLPERIDRTQ